MNQDENGIGNPKTISEIYTTLSAININEHLEKKGNLDYFQWARAVELVKQGDPGFTFKFASSSFSWDFFLIVLILTP